jgi:glyoxylase-like metal-dependent hydrolase (beta-lactamase superfamily II)
MEIARGIHRIVAPLGERFNALYLLVGERGSLLIDTGLAPDVEGTLLPYLDSIGHPRERVRYAINTHSDFDHMGGNGALRAAIPSVVLMCGELDRPMIEDVERMIDRRYGEFAADHGMDDTDETKDFIRGVAASTPVDIGLVGGERIGLDDDWHVEVLHTPGHSWGSVSVWDPRSRALMVGDAVLWNAVLLGNGDPAFPPTYRYLSTYVASAARLEGMAAELLLTSHYPVRRGPEVAEFLAETRAYTERVDAALAGALQARPHTLRELTEELGASMGGWPAPASAYLCYPFLGHLERMQEFGLVEALRRDDRDGILEYRWAGAGGGEGRA